MRDRAFIARTVREVRARRSELERGLARLGVRYFPSGGNFVLVYFGERAKKIVAALAARESWSATARAISAAKATSASRWELPRRRGACCAN